MSEGHVYCIRTVCLYVCCFRVFRTPTCLMLQDDSSFVHKIPLLGVNDTNTSWTSSMATTPADGHTLKTSLADILESDSSC